MVIEFRIRIVLRYFIPDLSTSSDGLAGRALTPEEYELGCQPLGACLGHTRFGSPCYSLTLLFVASYSLSLQY